MMPHRIEHLVEPDRLLLVWQSPDLGSDRTRRVVGELRKSSDTQVELRYLPEIEDFKIALQEGFIGYPAFPLDAGHTFSDVLSVFLRRLPPSSRADYPRYLETLCLPSGTSISPFALLGYSGAVLPSDSFSIIHPFDEAPVPCELLLEVAGVRHYWRENDPVEVGSSVVFVPEPSNKYDSLAIRIDSDWRCIGYVMRPQTSAMHSWLTNADVSAVVNRVNGVPSRPRVLLYVQIRQLAKAAA